LKLYSKKNDQKVVIPKGKIQLRDCGSDCGFWLATQSKNQKNGSAKKNKGLKL
jgi:hypothetical protein